MLAAEGRLVSGPGRTALPGERVVTAAYAACLQQLTELVPARAAPVVTRVACVQSRRTRPSDLAARRAVSAALRDGGSSHLEFDHTRDPHGAPLVNVRGDRVTHDVLLSTSSEGSLGVALAVLAGSDRCGLRGVGVDVISHGLGLDLLADCPAEVLARMFFAGELEAGRRSPHPADEHLLATVAIKEAAFKAAGVALARSGRSDPPQTGGFTELEVRYALTPQQRVVTHGGMRTLLRACGAGELLAVGFVDQGFVGAVAFAI